MEHMRAAWLIRWVPVAIWMAVTAYRVIFGDVALSDALMYFCWGSVFALVAHFGEMSERLQLVQKLDS